MNDPIPLDEIIPCGTKVACSEDGLETEWAFGDAIRQGGIGRVYAVIETRAPFRRGALKMLRPDREDAAAAFKREIERIKSRVAGEQGPAFYGRGTFRGRPFVIMEYGEPIDTDIGIRETLPLVDEIAKGLSTIHGNGFCHGDIKFHNLGSTDGHPKILDFGSIRSLIPQEKNEDLTRTPGIAAPELEENGCAAPWIDVYGLATTLNEILSSAALEVYSPAIRAGMDLRPEVRLQSPAELSAAMHDCYRAHRQRKLRMKIIRATTHLLVAGIAVAVSFQTAAASKRQFREKVIPRHLAVMSALSEKRLGRDAYINSNRAEAVRHFRNARDLGDRQAEKILRLMDETGK